MKNKSNVKNLARTAVMSAMLAIMAQIIIPLGPVPFSMAVFGVALISAVLPLKQALISVLTYMLLGFFGVPVFAGFNAGPQVLFGPTGGFLVGYFMLVLTIGFATKQSGAVVFQLIVALAGLAALYILGSFWFANVCKVGFVQAVSVCVLPFIVPDVCKILLALSVAKAFKKRFQAVKEL